jgi:putative FmdB family regulatory protein
MPIYEYQCDNCQQVTEAWQSLADEPLNTCQACAGSLRKLISRSSFHLKGGGWYADGYSSTAPGAKPCSKTESCPAKTTSDSGGATETKTSPPCAQGACCNA